MLTNGKNINFKNKSIHKIPNLWLNTNNIIINPTLTFYINYCKEYISLTEIDNYIINNYNFNIFRYYNNLNKVIFSLGKKNMWDIIIDILEKNYCNKNTNYDYNSNTTTISYTLPNIKSINNIYYNKIKKTYITSIFILKYNHINQKYDEYCNCYIKMPEFDNINIKPLKFRIINLKKKHFSSYKLIHSNINMKQSTNNNNNLKYNNEIIIDLYNETNIKAIGIIGEIHNVNIIKKNNNDNIYILDNKQLCWVTKYDLYIKSNITHQWEYIGNFIGNNNSFEEKINNFENINTRFIKIIPTQFNGNYPIFRIAIYGYNLNIIKSNDDNDDDKTNTYFITTTHNCKNINYHIKNKIVSNQSKDYKLKKIKLKTFTRYNKYRKHLIFL